MIIIMTMHDHKASKSYHHTLIVYKVPSEANPLHWIHGTMSCQRHSLCISLKTRPDQSSMEASILEYQQQRGGACRENQGGRTGKFICNELKHHILNWAVRTDDLLAVTFHNHFHFSLGETMKWPAPQQNTHTHKHTPGKPPPLSVCS